MEYALPYVLLVLFYGICAIFYRHYNEERIRKGIVVVCLLILILFFGFRGFCFYDWNSYYPTFEKVELDNVQKNGLSSVGFEPGFSILLIICKALYNNYNFFVLVCDIIDVALLYAFLRKRVDNIPLALMICLSMNGLQLLTDLMRNSIAILIFANSISLIKQRRLLPYMGTCLLAMSFHLSAILFIPCYFFLNKNMNKWVYLGIFIAANLVFLLHIPIFLTIADPILGLVNKSMQLKVKTYTEMSSSLSFAISIGYLERLFTGTLIFCYFEKIKNMRSEGNIFINSMVCYLCFYFFFSEFRTIGVRMSYLFTFAYWIIWSDLIKCFTYNGNRRLFIAFLGIYCLMKTYSSTNYPIARYDNVLFGAEPYQIRESIYNKTFDEVK